MKYKKDLFLAAFEAGNINIEAVFDRIINLENKIEKYEEILKISDELHMGHSMPQFSEFRRKYEDNRKKSI